MAETNDQPLSSSSLFKRANESRKHRATLLDAGRYSEAVIHFVKANRSATFGELEQLLSPYFEVKGEIMLGTTLRKNIFFWTGMSEKFHSLIADLIDSKELFFHLGHWLADISDAGRVPDLPMIKRNRDYKEPHWCPVVFRAYPLSRGFLSSKKRNP